MTHTTTEQPEALRLAEFFESMRKSSHRWYDGTPVHEKASAELRRLHDRVLELEAWLNPEHPRDKDCNGDYIDDTVYSMHAAWQAARRAPVVPMDAEHWAELHRLRAEVARSDGTKWQEVATQERMECNRLRAMLAAAPQPPEVDIDAQELEHTRREAESLAWSLFNRHFASDEHYTSGRVKFGLCDTLRGVLSQIDNMAAGLVRAPLAAPVQLHDALLTLETDAHYIFNNPPSETPQAVRDVIEWYAASVRQLLAQHGIK